MLQELVINHFKDTGRITDKIASNLLSLKHSGFNINNSIRIMGHDNKSREALAQYITRCPVSLKKISYESAKNRVIFKTKYNAYFKGYQKVFDLILFLGFVAQHIPVPKVRLIRYFGLYSSKSRGKWNDWEHVIKHAPEGWKEQNGMENQEDDDEPEESSDIDCILHKKSKKS